MSEIKPVAWRARFKNAPELGDWFSAEPIDGDLNETEPLYDQQAIDTLRAEVERLTEDNGAYAEQQLQALGKFWDAKARAERAEAALNLLERVLGPTVPTSVTSSGARCEWEEALKILAKSKAERT